MKLENQLEKEGRLGDLEILEYSRAGQTAYKYRKKEMQ